MEELNHIEIIKEDFVKLYKFRSNPNPPRIPNRDRKSHGKELKNELISTTSNIKSSRETLGVEVDKLLVLSIVGESMSSEILDNMIRKFNLSLVEESQISDTGNTKLIIQFPDSASIDAFNYERQLFEEDSEKEAWLTYAQRRNLFNCIEAISNLTREDRIGPRLRKIINNSEPMPDGFFIVDIDIWYNGDRMRITEIERILKQALGTVGSSLLGDLFEIPSLLLGRAKVNEFSLNALLDLDIIATIDLPLGSVSEEPYELYSYDFTPVINNNLDENAPLATVLDSGVFTGNPLLNSVVVAEEDFDNTENTTSDLNGHGTGVAGIVVYGDFNRCLESNTFTPLVRICSGKIMHDEDGRPVFPLDKRPEQVIKEAIMYFHKEYGCRIFNLSAGNSDSIYNGGRQFAWAEMLDQLVRTLDIVIVVSAGNVSDPVINEFGSREELMEKSRDQLFTREHALIDPATASLCITVGSISRFDEPEVVQNRSVRLSTGKRDYPSVFTRIGKGVNKAIKPEFVDYGGNYAVHQITRGSTRWIKTDRKLIEPTLNNNFDSIFKGYCGTSFSAPHVTHIAARIERALQNQMGEKPSANLIRAMLANSAICTPEMIEWAEQSKDSEYLGDANPKQERRLRLIGYGRVSDSILYSSEKQVTLFSEDSLDLRSFHLYKIPVPKEFLTVRASKRISISLAYNPITRLSRKEYLTNNLWFEVFKKIDSETLAQYKSKKETDNDEENDLSNFPNEYKTKFFPGYLELSKSTLQQRVWAKGERGGKDLLWDIDEPYIYVLVTGKERFKYPDQDVPQDYALVITYSYEGDQDINLYNRIKNQVRIRERQVTRSRAQIKI